jgi:predicted DNA-binding transcriptional regulator AlpA
MSRQLIDTNEPDSRRALQTGAAAKYLGVSTSLLRKLRLRGPADPGGQGPRFIKLSPQLVVYRVEDLDAWLDAHDTRHSGRAA